VGAAGRWPRRGSERSGTSVSPRASRSCSSSGEAARQNLAVGCSTVIVRVVLCETVPRSGDSLVPPGTRTINIVDVGAHLLDPDLAPPINVAEREEADGVGVAGRAREDEKHRVASATLDRRIAVCMARHRRLPRPSHAVVARARPAPGHGSGSGAPRLPAVPAGGRSGFPLTDSPRGRSIVRVEIPSADRPASGPVPWLGADV
jgi:hypothetical protein